MLTLSCDFFGADDGIRTRDPNLGNVKKGDSNQGIYATALVK